TMSTRDWSSDVCSSDLEKSLVEFMRDGPRSTGQSGHWLRFAADVSRRDRYPLDQDVRLFFAITNIVFDAFISCWEAKRYYDTSRSEERSVGEEVSVEVW